MNKQGILILSAAEVQLMEQRDQAERFFLSSLKDKREVLLAVARGMTASVFHQYGDLFRLLVESAASSPAPQTPGEAKPDETPAPLEVTPWNDLLQKSAMKQIPYTLSTLMDIEGLVPSGLEASKWGEAVIALSAKQNALNAIKTAQEAILADTTATKEAVKEQIDQLRARLGVVSELEDEEDGQIAPYGVELAEMIEHPERHPTMPHFIPAATHLFAPIHRHEMVIVAGRPGTGKTIWGVAQAMFSAQQNGAFHPALFISCEMNGPELLDRLVRQEAGPDCIGNHAAARSLYMETLRKLVKMKSLLVFDKRASRKIAWIEAKVNLLCQSGKRPSLLVVDYLQLLDVPPGTERSNRERQVAELSRRLKLIAKDYHVPVMVLCQINREVEKEGRKPVLSDLRESGALEQDADRVILLWKDATDGHVEAAQAKLRNGAAGVFLPLHLHGATYRLIPLANMGG